MAEAKSRSTRGDRLSELSNSLIHTILSFLDMRDVVRTTLLSKRWNNLWTALPFLHFKSFYGSVSTKNFVNRALESWKGTKIVQFSLDFVIFVLIPSDIVDSWLHFAIKKQVEDLYLNLRGSLSKFESHQRLYSCSSLRKLSILCFESKQIEEGRVKWNRLKSLLNKFSCSLKEDVMNKVISGSPHLEILDLRFVKSEGNLNIESTSLKMLKIRYDGFGGRQKAILRISAPNLETLEMFEVSYSRCLWNVPCLTNVVLDIGGQDYNKDGCNNYWDAKLLKLRPVFLSIRSVEKLTLSDWCFKVLEELKKKDKVVGDYDHEMFPKLKKMLIKPSYMK